MRASTRRWLERFVVPSGGVAVLFGGPAPRSNAETSLLDAAGRDAAQFGIRSTVADQDTRIVDKGQATITILQAQPADSNIASAQAGQ